MLLIVLTITLTTAVSTAVAHKTSLFSQPSKKDFQHYSSLRVPGSRFELSACDGGGPCSNSTDLPSLDDSADPVAARLEAFGEITSEFIASFAGEFSKSQNVAGVGGLWKNIGMTAPSAEGNYSPLIPSYIESGRIRNIYQHSENPNILYVLTAGGGLWKTINLFNSSAPIAWTPLGDNLLSTCGGNFALGNSSDTLYLGLGDPLLFLNSKSPGCIGGMMYVSHNGGSSWGAPTFFSLSVGGITYTSTLIFEVQVDRTKTPDMVLVSTELGIFRSTNGGVSFSHVYPTGNLTAINTGARTITFSMVQSIVQTSAGWMGFDYFPSTRALLLSIDGGASWSAPPDSNWATVTGSASGVLLGRTTFAVAHPRESIVYALVGAITNAVTVSDIKTRYIANTQRDVFKSTDGGIHWVGLHCNASRTPLNPIANVQLDLNVMGAQAWYGQMLLVDPTDPTRNTVYLGGQLSSVKTTNGGATWSVISTWTQSFSNTVQYIHADFHSAISVATPNGGSFVLFGTDGGMFASPDGGVSWFHELNEGLTAALINFISGSPLPSLTGILAAGLQDEGTKLRVGSSSELWNNVAGADGGGCAFNQVPTIVGGVNLLIASIYANSFYCLNISSPGQINLLYRGYCTVGINQSDTKMFFTNIVTPFPGSDPTGFVFYTYTGQTVYRSEFSVSSVLLWRGIGTNGVSQGLPKSMFRLALHCIGVGSMAQVAVCKQNTVSITTNGGTSWFEPNITEWFPYWNYTASPLWVNADGATLLFLSSESVASTTNVGGENALDTPRVIYTADSGLSWNSLSEGLPNVPVSKLAAYAGKVYAATWLGVFVHDLSLAPWRKLGAANLPSVQITDLYISSNLLYASSFGRGAWQFDTSTIPALASSAPSMLPRLSSNPTQSPQNAASPTTGSSNSIQLSDGAIAGIVIGSVVLGVCIAGLIVLIFLYAGKTGASNSSGPGVVAVTTAPPVESSSPRSVVAVDPDAGLNSTFSIESQTS